MTITPMRPPRRRVAATGAAETAVPAEVETTAASTVDPARVRRRKRKAARRKLAEAEAAATVTTVVDETVPSVEQQLDNLEDQTIFRRAKRKVRKTVEELIDATADYSQSAWKGLKARGSRLSARARELRATIVAHPAVERIRVTTDKTITGALGLVAGAAAVVVYTATGVVYLGAAGTAMLIVGGVCVAVWGIQAVGVVGSYVLAAAEVGAAFVNDAVASFGSYLGLEIPAWDQWSMFGTT